MEKNRKMGKKLFHSTLSKHTYSDSLPPDFLLLVRMESHGLLFPVNLSKQTKHWSKNGQSRISNMSFPYQNFNVNCFCVCTCVWETEWPTLRSFSMVFSAVSLCSNLSINSKRTFFTCSSLRVLCIQENEPWSDVLKKGKGKAHLLNHFVIYWDWPVFVNLFVEGGHVLLDSF